MNALFLCPALPPSTQQFLTDYCEYTVSCMRKSSGCQNKLPFDSRYKKCEACRITHRAEEAGRQRRKRDVRLHSPRHVISQHDVSPVHSSVFSASPPPNSSWPLMAPRRLTRRRQRPMRPMRSYVIEMAARTYCHSRVLISDVSRAESRTATSKQTLVAGSRTRFVNSHPRAS